MCRPLWQIRPIQGNPLEKYFLINLFYIFSFISNISFYFTLKSIARTINTHMSCWRNVSVIVAAMAHTGEYLAIFFWLTYSIFTILCLIYCFILHLKEYLCRYWEVNCWSFQRQFLYIVVNFDLINNKILLFVFIKN